MSTVVHDPMQSIFKILTELKARNAKLAAGNVKLAAENAELHVKMEGGNAELRLEIPSSM